MLDHNLYGHLLGKSESMGRCRSLDREAHYVDLEAQPVTGPGQADLRHLLPADTNPETSGTSATSTAGHASNSQSDTGTSSSSSTALNPAANAPVGAKATKGAKAAKVASAKGGKKGATEEPSPSLPSTSLQDVAMELVQQVSMHASESFQDVHFACMPLREASF